MSARTTWKVEDFGSPVYLGGVEARYGIEGAGSTGERIAYAFEPEQAHLIAAGPNLLAALVMVRDADEDAIRDGLPRIPNLPRASIDAAIAMATGGTVDQRTVDIPL